MELRPAEGDNDELTDDDGLALADGLRDFEALRDPEALGDKEGETDSLGLWERLLLADGESDVDWDTEADTEWLVPSNPSSSKACPHVKVSDNLRMSMLEINLAEPTGPRSLKELIPPWKLLSTMTAI